MATKKAPKAPKAKKEKPEQTATEPQAVAVDPVQEPKQPEPIAEIVETVVCPLCKKTLFSQIDPQYSTPKLWRREKNTRASKGFLIVDQQIGTFDAIGYRCACVPKKSK
jgi:hypothetical protein